jgi:hypothetical protein
MFAVQGQVYLTLQLSVIGTFGTATYLSAYPSILLILVAAAENSSFPFLSNGNGGRIKIAVIFLTLRNYSDCA